MENSLLLIMISICLITDIKKQKIYNTVLLPAFIGAIGINFISYGFTGLQTTALGFVVGLLILILPFILGGMGAGDVKLLAIIGAIKGPVFACYTAIAMGIVGGIIAIVLLIWKKRFLSTVKELFKGLRLIFITKFKIISFNFDKEDNMFPYGIAIAMGTLLTLFIVG